MDTKFSVALHSLIYIAKTDKVPSSENLAQSVNTNASHIRKITGLLKQAGILASHQGKSGFYLTKSPEDMTLKDIYQAVYPDKVLLHVHGDTNQDCPVGQRVVTLLTPIFAQAEDSLLSQLDAKTLADLISEMYTIN